MNAPCGWLVIDKPLGITSRDAVNRAQSWFPPRTALGHCGTLDPLASGVLVLAVGPATRLAEYVQQLGKVYESEFTLGATSATDDAEGPITRVDVASDPGRSAIEAALQQFVGVINQIPPNFSAVKVEGSRAYNKARVGKPVDLTPRPVRVDAIELTGYDYPKLQVTIRCGKGTYIRSLARDLGAALGCGGYVSQLRRTAIGDFTPAAAVSLDTQRRTVPLIPLARGVAGLQRLNVSTESANRLIHGGFIPNEHTLPPNSEAAAFDGDQLIAIVSVQSDGTIRPIKVLASQSH